MRLRLLLVLALTVAASSSAAQTPEPARPAPAPVTVAPLSEMGLRPGLIPGAALSGLAPVGDSAPVCRAQCNRDRSSCGTDDEQCTERWTQCLSACAGEARRR